MNNFFKFVVLQQYQTTIIATENQKHIISIYKEKSKIQLNRSNQIK